MRWRKPIWELAVTGHVLARCSTVAAVVWDSWSHVCGPVLDWPCALRWWWQLTSLIHWEYELCCVPHNGSTHRQQTSSLFTVHLPVVFFSGTLTPLSLPLCSGTDSGLFFSFCIVASIQTQGMAAAFSRLTHTVVSCVKCDFSPDMHSPHTSLKASPSHRFWSAYCLAFPGRSVGSTRPQF